MIDRDKRHPEKVNKPFNPIKRKPEWIDRLLCEGQRSSSAATAPARGLYLVDVDYPIEYALPRDKKGPFFLRENP